MEIELALYQALTGVGACSLLVSLPTALALGVQATPLASAVMTSSSAYSDFERQICHGNLQKAAKQYKALGLSPQALLVGYVPSLDLYKEIYQFKELFPNCFLALDPVLGDNARMYSNMGADLILALQKLSKLADLLSPNLTEALLLANRPLTEYHALSSLTEDEANQYAQSLYLDMNLSDNTYLALKGWSLRTGAEQITTIGRNYLISKQTTLSSNFTWAKLNLAKQVYKQISGTGDFFITTLVASWLKCKNWQRALNTATELASVAVNISFRYLAKLSTQLQKKYAPDMLANKLELAFKQGLVMPEILPILIDYRHKSLVDKEDMKDV